MTLNRAVERSRLVTTLPGALRSAAKRILVRAGLYDERAAAVRLSRLYPDDTFIVSYPKSGNTWVRFLLASMLAPDETITFRNLERYVPDVARSREFIDRLPPPRYIKTHRPFYTCFPRMVYIYRDVRDALVSYYHYEAQNGRFRGTLSEFLRSDAPNYYGPWHRHVGEALEFAERHPERVLLLRYERMLEDPVEAARQLAAFCRIDAPEDLLLRAVEGCRFDRLRKIETQFGPEREGSAAPFFRSGRAGGWREELSEADLRLILDSAGPLLARLGYPV